jgi:glutathione S-transferase
MLELYHYEPSANSAKPMICLKEKGLDFVSHYIDLHAFQQHSPECLKVNPNGQVPALVHDGKVITESTVINEYLEDVFPQVPLRPADPYERAEMRIWSKFVDEYYCPSLSLIAWHHMIQDIVKDLSSEQFDAYLARIPLHEQREKWRLAATKSFPKEQLDDAVRKLRFSMKRHEERLRKWTWLAGSTYSLADVNTYSMTAAMPFFFSDFVNEKDTPRTLGWLRRMEARPGVQAALAMARKPLRRGTRANPDNPIRHTA